MKSLSPSEQHHEFVDGLRGIAILIVMAQHWHFWVTSRLTQPWHFPMLEGIVNVGHMGVVLFFLLSAFTLFLSCEHRFGKERHPYRNFYIRRAFRILPLWWVALFFYAGRNFSVWWQHLCCAFFFFGFSMQETHLFFPGWTLFVEETFYLLLPVLFPLITSLPRALCALGLLYGARYLWFSIAGDLPLATENLHPVIFPLAHWYAFALGIVLRFIQKSRFLDRPALEIEKLTWVLDIAVVGSFGGLMFPSPQWGSTDAKAALFFAVLFIAAISPRTLTGKLCRGRLLQKFGICCYSLYLFHPFVISYLETPLRRLLTALPNIPRDVLFGLSFPVFAIAMLGLGWISFTFFESYTVRLGKRVVRISEEERLPPRVELFADDAALRGRRLGRLALRWISLLLPPVIRRRL